MGGETKNESELTRSSLFSLVGGCEWWWLLIGGWRDEEQARSSLFSVVGGWEDEENPPTSHKDSLVVVVAGRWVERQRTSQN